MHSKFILNFSFMDIDKFIHPSILSAAKGSVPPMSSQSQFQSIIII